MPRDERVENLLLSTQSLIRSWKSNFYKVLGPEKLSPALVNMLSYLASHAPVSGRIIGEALYLSPSAASQILDGLDSRGFITRERRAGDRRVTYFGLTEAGEKMAAALDDKRKEFFSSVTVSLSDAEIDTMVRLQQKLIQEIKSQPVETTKEVTRVRKK
jgi:DNA-binding MarR family transcriptional regulator